jgi:TPR repeat protein
MITGEEYITKALKCYHQRRIKRTINYLEKGVALNCPEAMLKLAQFYLMGVRHQKRTNYYLVPKDHEKFLALTQRALDLGCKDAHFNMYLYYLKQRDWENCLLWIKSGVEAEHAYCTHMLAEAYEKGKFGLTIDYEKAMELYRKAADMGDKSSLFRMAEAYRYGQMVETNPSKAIELYERCAEADDTYAMHVLACIYRDGLCGQEPDSLKAAEWEDRSGAPIDSTTWLFSKWF